MRANHSKQPRLARLNIMETDITDAALGDIISLAQFESVKEVKLSKSWSM